MKSRLAACALMVLASGCGSDPEPAGDALDASVPTDIAPAVPAAKVSGDFGDWDEPTATPATEPAIPYNPGFRVPEPAAPPDPDAVIGRYASECPGGATSDSCRELRVQVEGVFLDALVALRGADQEIDRQWYRIAAAAETPQLACIGLRELILSPGRTAADEALIVAALDSPWRSVRGAVLAWGAKVPGVDAIRQREVYGLASRECIDGGRDPEPGPKWAGGYPGARYRPFASSATRRWFTTPDSLEQVLDFFERAGKPARTADELAADANARFIAEATRISESPDADNEAQLARLMQHLTGQSQTNWSAAFRDVQGAGEIRYVMLAERQAIAVFRDEVLNATSIVAPRPAAAPDLAPDMEQAELENLSRLVFRY